MYEPDIVEANAHGVKAANGTGDLPDIEKDGYLDPVAGHGMFIAGLILRYAPGTSVQVVEALSTYGDGDEDQIATAIEGLFPDGNGPTPDIVSLSFGTYTPELPERLALAVQKAIAGGAVVVASAGNDGTSQKQYPAAYDGVVSVAALGPNGPAPFSNWGDWVRACAPGVDVPSGFWTFDGTSAAEAGADRDRYQGWALWSGTSFAAPIVAAAIAQTMQRGFDANPAMELVVEYPGLHRLPCYGTVVNPPPAIPTL
jgi:subtilisin family serine protease